MARTFPAGVLTAIGATATSILELIKITPTVGAVLAFTNYTENLTVDSVTYLARPGMQVSVIQGKINLEIDASTAQGFFQSGVITFSDILKGKFNDAAFERYFCNADSVASGKGTTQTGYIGRVDIADNAFQAELRGLAAALSQPVGRITSKRCDVRTVGDARCQFNLATTQAVTGINFTQTLTVSSVTDQEVFDVSGVQGGTEADWWTYGTLTWLTGNNAGYSSDIARSDDSGGWYLVLVNAPGADIQTGDTLSAKAGCDRTGNINGHCHAKFRNAAQPNGNLVNFRGFRDLIGDDLYVPLDKLQNP